MKMQKKEPRNQAQANKFRDAARELECDDDEAAFDEKLGKITRQKPGDRKPKPK